MSNWSEEQLADAVAANPALALRNGSRLTRTAVRREPATSHPSGAVSPVEASILLKAKGSGGYPPLTFTIMGSPVPKPRQVRSDKWKKHPSVLRYRKWADDARTAARNAIGQRFPGLVLDSYSRLQITAFFPIPPSWNKTLRAKKAGKPHMQAPDIDNIAKACLDALFPINDSHIYKLGSEKFWDDGGGPRMLVMLF